MPQAPCFESTSCRSQRGDALLEALIGLLMMAIIGLGLTFAAAKTIASQRLVNTQNIAMTTIRDQLQTQGLSTLCSSDATIAVASSSTTLSANGSCTQNTVTISGPGLTSITMVPGTPTALTLSTANSTANQNLLGDTGQIAVSQ